MAVATNGAWLDPVRQWRGVFERICELVEGSTSEAMHAQVPATPAWRARDLVAHVVGLDSDVLTGREPDDHDEAWTQGHVDARADRTVAEVLAEWREDADKMLVHLRDEDTRPFVDLVIHEQDLHGALQTSGLREIGGIDLVRTVMSNRLAVAVQHLRPLRLESDDWTWTSHTGEPGAVLRASSFDLFRALHSRRTPGQLRSWVVAGDVGPYLDGFAGVGPLPVGPLAERASLGAAVEADGAVGVSGGVGWCRSGGRGLGGGGGSRAGSRG